MLLCDRILERLGRIRRDIGDRWTGSREASLELVLRGAPVYDLSSVATLFSDWEAEKEKKVPRRPPHEVMWGEWVTRLTDADAIVRCGALLTALKTDARPLDERFRHLNSECELVASSEVVYSADVFVCMEKTNDPELRFNLGRPRQILGACLFTMSADGTEIEQRMYEFDCQPMAGFGHMHGEAIAVFNPWPLFMAFALLHCKNVVTENNVPEERIQRQCEKHGNPPRVTYKTLRIEVPATVHKKQSVDAEDDGSGPKVRFHLCSGHFKNLQHERYKDKGWHWWPAHWRGAKELGEVHKRYELRPDGSQ